LLCAFYFLLQNRNNKNYHFIAGIFVGLSFFSKQNIGAIGFLLFILFIPLKKNFVKYLSGFIAIFLFFSIYYLSIGAFNGFIENFIINPLLMNREKLLLKKLDTTFSLIIIGFMCIIYAIAEKKQKKYIIVFMLLTLFFYYTNNNIWFNNLSFISIIFVFLPFYIFKKQKKIFCFLIFLILFSIFFYISFNRLSHNHIYQSKNFNIKIKGIQKFNNLIVSNEQYEDIIRLYNFLIAENSSDKFIILGYKTYFYYLLDTMPKTELLWFHYKVTYNSNNAYYYETKIIKEIKLKKIKYVIFSNDDGADELAHNMKKLIKFINDSCVANFMVANNNVYQLY